jgi:hypothetical protein
MSRCLLLVLLLPLLTNACSWGRFDDAEDNAPVVSLKKPGELTGFGVSLASAASSAGVRLLVGGSAGNSPAAVYDIGRLGDPGLDALEAGYCNERDTCFLASQPAGVPLLAFGEEPHELCFATGVHQSQSSQRGVLLRCADRTSFTLPVPAPVVQELETAFAGAPGRAFVTTFDSDDRPVPALAAASASAKFAWVYAAGSAEPIALVPASDDSSYGEGVAVLSTAQGVIVAVAAPEQSHVWLFRDDGQALGCLAGGSGFGRALAGGIVNLDADDDLVVADAGNVSVFDGAVLATLPVSAAADCSGAALPPAALITSFGCGTTSDISGCERSEFGAALAVGDLDGDADGEIAVGAPGMTVRGQARAGAVLLYDVEPEAPTELGDVRFMSSSETGAGLGSAVLLPRIGQTSIVAAGAPGVGKTALFYCSRLTPAALRAGRCE